MRIFLAIFNAAVLIVGVSPREVPPTPARGRLVQQAPPKPANETRKRYNCPAAADEPSAKPVNGAAGRKEQRVPDAGASLEFCLELDRPAALLEEYVRPILKEAGWTLPATTPEKRGILAMRRLTVEELRRAAQTEIGGGKINWEEGMANAEIRLIPLGGAGTQVRVRARILAKGSTSLRLMRPSPWWSLASTGALEGDILAALEARCSVKP
jgi:hypothetical protein